MVSKYTVENPVPAFGSARRLQALMAIGWSLRTLARRWGVTYSVLHRVAREGQPSLDARHEVIIRRMYDNLWSTPGESKRWLEYPPPLAWDEEDIDRPKGRPHEWRETCAYGHARVEWERETPKGRVYCLRCTYIYKGKEKRVPRIRPRNHSGQRKRAYLRLKQAVEASGGRCKWVLRERLRYPDLTVGEFCARYNVSQLSFNTWAKDLYNQYVKDPQSE